MKRVCVALLGFVTASMYGQNTGPLAAAKAACGAGEPKYSVTAASAKVSNENDEGKAQLYLLQVQDHVANCPLGCGQTVKLGLDGEWAGATKGNSYLVLPVIPGEHHLCAEWDARAWRLHGIWNWRPFQWSRENLIISCISPQGRPRRPNLQLQPVNEDEGKLLVASRTRIVWTKKALRMRDDKMIAEASSPGSSMFSG